MIEVRIKNSKLIYTVYAIDEADTGDIIFLVFDTVIRYGLGISK